MPKLISLRCNAAFATSFGVKAVMKTSVLLTWEVPENYKSQVPFKVRAHAYQEHVVENSLVHFPVHS